MKREKTQSTKERALASARDPYSHRTSREREKEEKNEKKVNYAHKQKNREYDERTLWTVVTNHAKK